MKAKHARGFTLIELLVVISIIGMLSSITMSSLNSARDKANFSYSASAIDEYVKALNLYYNENGHYPVPTFTGTYATDRFCLSDPACYKINDTVPASTYPQDSNFAASLSPFLKQLSPVLKKQVDINQTVPIHIKYSYTDALYMCGDAYCNTASLQWPRDPSKPNCSMGARKTGHDNLDCVLDLK